MVGQGQSLDQKGSRYISHGETIAELIFSQSQAARSAGIEPVILLHEPEAAALHAALRSGGQNFRVGDAFVVCDAGGGTTDVASYEILSPQPTSPFNLKELAVANGTYRNIAGCQIIRHPARSMVRNGASSFG